MNTVISLLATIMICSSGFCQSYIGKQKDIDKILENTAKFSEHIMKADYDKISESYTVDGKIFPNRRDSASLASVSSARSKSSTKSNKTMKSNPYHKFIVTASASRRSFIRCR